MDIKVAATNQVLSPRGGLILLKKVCQKLDLFAKASEFLPKNKKGNKSSTDKFSQILYGFHAGAENLDDLERLAFDPAFSSICDDKVYTAKTCGNFLRGFTHLQCKQMNGILADTAFKLRSQFQPSDPNNFIMDFDSTPNQQYGQKMEGVEVNYKGIRCLDTLQAFDEFGFQYWTIVRPGATYSSNGVEEMVHGIFSRMPKTKEYKKTKKYARGDSAFCNTRFFNACAVKNVRFVVCMKKNIANPLIKRVKNWQYSKPNSEKGITFHDGRECEIGDTLYYPDRYPKPVRVIMIRAVKRGREHSILKTDEDYDYYMWASDIGEHVMSNESLIRFYRKRGAAENFIKEVKYGYDLKHYPCQKLVANKAYSIIGAFAHNCMRLLSLASKPEKPKFAKALRNQFINLPCQVIRHGRQVIFKFMKHHHKEVNHWLKILKKLQFGFA